MAQIDDPKRLASLRATALLDAGSDEAFERLTRLATRLLGTSVAAISLIDANRQFFLAQTGMTDPWASRRQTPLSYSFCKHVVESEAPLRIDHASEHPLVRDSLGVSEMGVEAYLGVPLVTPEGDVLGALCAVDGVPHVWSDDDLRTLSDLSAMVMSEAQARATGRELAASNDRLRRLTEAAFEGISVTWQGTIVDVNEAFCQMFGYTHEQVVGMRAAALVAPSERERIIAIQRDGFEGVYETTGQRAGGSTFPMEVRGRRVSWGERTARVTAVRDLTERVAAEQQRRLYGEILANMTEGVCVVRASDATIVYTNPTFATLYGHEPGELDGRPVDVLYVPGAGAPADPEAHARLQGLRVGERVQTEIRNARRDGSLLWCRVTASAMHDPVHGVVRVGVHEDITEMKRESAALARQTSFVELLRAAATDANEAETSAAAIRATLSCVASAMRWPVGHAYRVVETPDGPQLEATELWYLDDSDCLEGFRAATASVVLGPGAGLSGRVFASGQAHWVEDVCTDPTFVRREAAQVCGLHGGFAFPVRLGSEVVAVLEFYSSRIEAPDSSLLDVMGNVGTLLGRVVERERSRTLLEQRAAEVRALSLRDELTGLYNRRGFLELSRHGIRLADRTQRPALVIFIDLNGMKPINDRFGHEEGDRALRAAAAVLRETFRDSDVMARLGGDEFAVFAPDMGADHERLFLDRLRASVQAFNDIADATRPWRLSLSTGVSSYDPSARRTIEDVLEEADARMYEAKRRRVTTGESGPPPSLAASIPPARPSTSPLLAPRPSTRPRASRR